MPLTDTKIKSLKSKEKRYKVSDFDGLYIAVNPNGSKLWRLKYRFEGKEKLLSFGKYPYTTLQHARQLRDEARTLLAQGLDPSAERKKDKAEIRAQNEHSFAKLAAQYRNKLVKEGKSEETLKKKDWLLGMANADFGHIPINEIDAKTVLITLKKREAMGHYETVGRLRSTIGAVFRFAVASGVAETDPTYALKDATVKPTVKHRAAITDKATLKRFIKALRDYHGHPETKIALKLLMLFASRPGEIRQAKWSEFDFDNRVWSLDAERMKMRRPHHVSLCQETIDLLAELKPLTGWGDYLFPSQSSSKKPISENTLNQALRRMGLGQTKSLRMDLEQPFQHLRMKAVYGNPMRLKPTAHGKIAMW